MRQLLTSGNHWQSWLHKLVFALFFLVFSLGLMITPAQATGVYDLPPLTAGSSTWIIDQADTISRSNEGVLNTTLKNLATQTGNEVRMVVIRRLDFDETIENFADKLFAKWFPTPETQANQTLLVVDTLTNATAIRTGDAVAKVLNDEIAKSVVDETVAVPLKDGGKYNQALLDASDRLVAVLSGQSDPGPPTIKVANLEGTFASAEETDDRSSTIWVIVLLIVATVVPMVTYFWYVGFPGN
jgi:uncharacterized protein